tara:strand:+ start:2249 stop:2737 length:489 start_codon:yes stop_codon:yes gene_type:complete
LTEASAARQTGSALQGGLSPGSHGTVHSHRRTAATPTAPCQKSTKKDSSHGARDSTSAHHWQTGSPAALSRGRFISSGLTFLACFIASGSSHSARMLRSVHAKAHWSPRASSLHAAFFPSLVAAATELASLAASTPIALSNESVSDGRIEHTVIMQFALVNV